MSPRALVTGGAGFIGSHLAEELLATGWWVDVLDDLSTGRKRNLAPLSGHPALTFIEGSATDPATLARLIRQADVVFHLAAAVGVKLIVDQPVQTISTNIKATELVLELAAQKKGTKVLVASTSEVYGKLDAQKFSESDDLVLGPTDKSRWCYAASKIIDEHLALAYARQTRLPVTVLRFFNTIGPRQTGQYGMVVPRFVRQALKGEPLTVYGDGTQRRSFCHVADVVRALCALCAHPSAHGRVYNVGATSEISMAELGKLVNAKVGNAAGLRFVPYAEAYASGFEDMLRRVPDITRVQSLIDWKPVRSLDEILDDVIRHEKAVAQAGA